MIKSFMRKILKLILREVKKSFPKGNMLIFYRSIILTLKKRVLKTVAEIEGVRPPCTRIALAINQS